MKTYLRLLICLLFVGCTKSENEAVSGDEEMISPAGQNSSLPYLTTGGDGDLYMSWVEKKDSGWVELKYSKLDGDDWMEPELIARGNDWFVNWADYPMLAVDKSGNMMAHYLAKSSSGTYSYDVNLVLKPIGGQWSEPLIPHKDGTPTEHGFVTMLPQEDDNFQVAWLDGRNTGGGDHETHNGGAMTVRTALIDVQGNIQEEVELDNRVCDCCQTTGANTSNGPVVFYRDRSEMEIRDISIVRKLDQEWSKPLAVFEDNWNIEGCPVNGPRADADGESLVVAWFTMANNQPKVKLIFSEDGGELFSKPIVIDALQPIGRVDVASLGPNEAAVSWLTMEEGKALIKLMKVQANGYKSKAIVIAETDQARGSGFPQLSVSKGILYMAWTHIEGDHSTVKMEKIGLANWPS